MRRVKFLFPLCLLAAFSLSACNTIENRRSVYRTNKGDGPYSRALRDGTWGQTKPVDQQYAEAKKKKTQTLESPTPAPAPAEPPPE